ncbi:hypothetical protein [Salegentibacter sediminis]|uniref:hypothetical protein n=1 Tax=Salegentibacter sediminis TaxID=1930251 RepID=UPI0009BE59C5|nr:hypothetical protein [Salegentibacter sediminis]
MKSTLLFFLFLSSLSVFSQVGVGTTTPGAQLDIVASNPSNPENIDGLLIPRINNFPAVNPGAAQHGMLIYLNNNLPKFPVGFYYWHNQDTEWKSIVSDAKAANFYKENTLESPGNVDDPIFRKGNIGIGTEQIVSKLQIAINPGVDLDIKKGIEVVNSNSEDTRNTYGIEVKNSSKTNDIKYGIKNHVTGDGGGIRYGIYNTTSQGLNTTDIYGIYNSVGRTDGASSHNYGIYTEIGEASGRGNIYGIYAKALGNSSSEVFAGYFEGRVGIGSNPANDYVLPDLRGTEGQVLMAENNGEVKWKNSGHKVYSSTTSSTGNYDIPDETYTLRINNNVSGINIPDASTNKGRIIILINWPGNATKNLNFKSGDNLLDLKSNTQINQINSNEVFTIQSAGNRWLLLYK